jgi:hypothetical protein
MNFICQIIEFQLFGHIFCCFSQRLRPWIGIAEKYGMNTCTLIFLDPVKLSGSTTNSQESQNLKASLLQMTTTDKSKKPTKQKFPNSWSSSMKWSMQSNTKSNLAPIEKMLIYDPHEISQKTSKILRLSSIYSRQARRHLKPEWKWANLKAGFLVWNDPDPWLIRALQPVRDLLSLP